MLTLAVMNSSKNILLLTALELTRQHDNIREHEDLDEVSDEEDMYSSYATSDDSDDDSSDCEDSSYESSGSQDLEDDDLSSKEGFNTKKRKRVD